MSKRDLPGRLERYGGAPPLSASHSPRRTLPTRPYPASKPSRKRRMRGSPGSPRRTAAAAGSWTRSVPWSCVSASISGFSSMIDAEAWNRAAELSRPSGTRSRQVIGTWKAAQA